MIGDLAQPVLLIGAERPVDASAPGFANHTAAERHGAVGGKSALLEQPGAPFLAPGIGALVERGEIGARRARIGDDQRDADAGEQNGDPGLHRALPWWRTLDRGEAVKIGYRGVAG
jgi:hypothetical protein